MVLPFLKLGLLAVKQAAKPIAASIKTSAVQSNSVRQSMISVGRRLHYNVFQLNRVAEGNSMLKKERVPVLNEKEALAKGSDFLAEMVVYSITAGVLLAEVQVSSRKAKQAEAEKAAKKAAKRAKEAQEHAENEERQWAEFQRLNTQLTALQARLSALEDTEARHAQVLQRGRSWW